MFETERFNPLDSFIHKSQKNGFEIFNRGEVANGQGGLEEYKFKLATRIHGMYYYYCSDFKKKDWGDLTRVLKEYW
ncbi:MAG: hypothetical protein IH950_09315 [Bacteroidetes bacterium]|nr:hypothetical protein [Bacteroidota bacterium]